MLFNCKLLPPLEAHSIRLMSWAFSRCNFRAFLTLGAEVYSFFWINYTPYLSLSPCSRMIKQHRQQLIFNETCRGHSKSTRWHCTTSFRLMIKFCEWSRAGTWPVFTWEKEYQHAGGVFFLNKTITLPCQRPKSPDFNSLQTVSKLCLIEDDTLFGRHKKSSDRRKARCASDGISQMCEHLLRLHVWVASPLEAGKHQRSCFEETINANQKSVMIYIMITWMARKSKLCRNKNVMSDEALLLNRPWSRRVVAWEGVDYVKEI